MFGGISCSTLAFLMSHQDAEQLGPTVVEAAAAMSEALGAPCGADVKR